MFEFLPENRKIRDENIQKLIYGLIIMDCPKARIRNKVEQETGMKLLAKDLQN